MEKATESLKLKTENKLRKLKINKKTKKQLRTTKNKKQRRRRENKHRQVTALRGIVSLVAIYHMGNLPGNQMNMQLGNNKFLFPFLF